jgi:predicted small secreted protein
MRPVAALLAVLVLAPAAAACGTGTGTGEDPRSCPAPRPAKQPGPLVRALALDDLGVPTGSREEAELSSATVVSDRSVSALLGRVHDALEGGGYNVLGTEDEGFEAEIFFAKGLHTNGVARITEDARCAGRTTVEVSVARGTAAPSGSPGPS